MDVNKSRDLPHMDTANGHNLYRVHRTLSWEIHLHPLWRSVIDVTLLQTAFVSRCTFHSCRLPCMCVYPFVRIGRSRSKHRCIDFEETHKETFPFFFSRIKSFLLLVSTRIEKQNNLRHTFNNIRQELYSHFIDARKCRVV